MMLDEKSGVTKVITIHPEGDINVCTNCDTDPSQSCWDISVWTTDRPTSRQADIAEDWATPLAWLIKGIVQSMENIFELVFNQRHCY